MLILQPGKPTFDRLVFDITVTCDEARKQARAAVEIIPENGDFTAYINGRRLWTLDELTKNTDVDDNARRFCELYLGALNP